MNSALGFFSGIHKSGRISSNLAHLEPTPLPFRCLSNMLGVLLTSGVEPEGPRKGLRVSIPLCPLLILPNQDT